MTETARGPRVGETVLYALEGGDVLPATVTKVHDAETVNLRVLLDVSAFSSDGIPEYWTKEWLEHSGYYPPEYAVRYDANGEGGTWRHVE